MIKQTFYIKEYDWTIYAYFAVDCYYVDEIMEHLFKLRCNGTTAKRAYENLSACKLDTGLTFSSFELRKTIMVVGLTSSANEFFNSFHHELIHCEAHICKANKLDPYGEGRAYMVGDLSMQMFPYIQPLLCDKCRNNKLKED